MDDKPSIVNDIEDEEMVDFDLGEEVYLTTAYFVDPSSICQGTIHILRNHF